MISKTSGHDFQHVSAGTIGLQAPQVRQERCRQDCQTILGSANVKLTFPACPTKGANPPQA